MKMKKISLICLIAAVAVVMSSCLGDPEDKRTYSITVSNMIIPDDVNAPVTVSHNCTYNLSADYISHKLTVNTTNLSLPGMSDLSFTSNVMDCTNVSSGPNFSGSFGRGSAHLSNGMDITGLNGFYTSLVYSVEVTGDPFRFYVTNPMLVMNYHAGNYTVKTFSMNPFFRGTTITKYKARPEEGEEEGREKTFSYGDATYRVNFAQDMKTANVIIYNAKFALEMPNALQAVVLKDLPVELTHSEYVIKASNVIPEVLEGGVLIPYQRFVFNNFTLTTTSNDLTEVQCEYQVAGMYRGSFTGSYCNYYSASAQ